MVDFRVLIVLFDFQRLTFFILAIGYSSCILSEPIKGRGTCLNQGPISALLIFFSIYDLRVRFWFP